jgi:prolyl oligopeptidase
MRQNLRMGTPDIAYPATPHVDVVEEHFGRRIADPYRWLEGDARSDARVAAWVPAQNAATQAHLSALPDRETFRERLAAMLDHEQTGAPTKRGRCYFYVRMSGEDSQYKLLLREGSDGRERVLIDPHGWSEDHADALAEWEPSDDGRLVAYAMQRGGRDWRSIRVLDVETGETLPDEVEWARFMQIAWAKDGSGFFYSRYPEPRGGAQDTAGVADHAVWFHRLGERQDQDRLIHATPSRPDLLHVAGRTDDGRHLVVYSTQGAGANALAVVDLKDADRPVRQLIDGFDAEWSAIGEDGDRLFVLTNDSAERRRIVTFDLAQGEPKPVEIVPEDSAVLRSAALLGGRLLASYLVDAQTEVRRFRLDGTPDGTVDLPGIGSAGGFKGEASDDEAFYIFTSYDTPITVYRHDVRTGRSEVWAQPQVPVDPETLSVEQRFYASKDGTRVPIFIVRRHDAAEPQPTLLYGYGGFGISMVPVYNPMHMAWIEQGGAVAVANIRGGGEYGRAWHDAARFEKRQNAFDDFIAAGEFLKAQGITPDDGLAIQGESNGGLLVGAVVNQRPELFAAALPGVGVMDLLRYHQFTGGAMWMHDFGSPEEERHFAHLLAISPCHNIRAGRDYPAILATTADADDRVVPGHTFKYVAALQAADLGPRPRLARIETRAGHGAGMPRRKIIDFYADLWAFAAHWTGLELSRP